MSSSGPGEVGCGATAAEDAEEHREDTLTTRRRRSRSPRPTAAPSAKRQRSDDGTAVRPSASAERCQHHSRAAKRSQKSAGAVEEGVEAGATRVERARPPPMQTTRMVAPTPTHTHTHSRAAAAAEPPSEYPTARLVEDLYLARWAPRLRAHVLVSRSARVSAWGRHNVRCTHTASWVAFACTNHRQPRRWA